MYKVSENAENLTISNNIHLFDSHRGTNWILHGFSKLQPHALDWSINTCIKCSVFSNHMTVHTHTHLYTFTSTNIITQKQKKEKCVSTNIKTSSFTMFQLVLNPKTHSFQNEWKLANILPLRWLQIHWISNEVLCGLQGLFKSLYCNNK